MYQAVPKTVWTSLTNSAAAYSSGEVVGGLLTWDVKKLSAGAAGMVTAAIVLDRDNVKGALDLILFNEAPDTPMVDGDTLDSTGWDQDHQEKMIGSLLAIAATDYTSRNSLARALVAWDSRKMPIYGDGRSGNNAGALYGYLIAKGTHDFTHTDALQVGLDVWRF